MLYSRQLGSPDKAPVILLHGLFGSAENLAGIGRLLAEQFCVYLVDLPNHGKSPHITHGTLSVYAEYIAQWMSDAGLVNPSVVGHSLGGKVAMELALSHPERVAQLVVMDISPTQYSARHTEVFAGLFAIDLAQLTDRAQADAVLAQYVPTTAVRSFLLKNLQRGAAQFEWRVNLSDLKNSYSHLISANRLGQYSGPVLFLKGERSDYIRLEQKPEILQRFPQAILKIVADTEHWLHAEKPELVARLIAKFLNSSSLPT